MKLERQLALSVKAFREYWLIVPTGRKAFRMWTIAWFVTIVPAITFACVFILAVFRPF